MVVKQERSGDGITIRAAGARNEKNIVVLFQKLDKKQRVSFALMAVENESKEKVGVDVRRSCGMR